MKLIKENWTTRPRVQTELMLKKAGPGTRGPQAPGSAEGTGRHSQGVDQIQQQL